MLRLDFRVYRIIFALSLAGIGVAQTREGTSAKSHPAAPSGVSSSAVSSSAQGEAAKHIGGAPAVSALAGPPAPPPPPPPPAQQHLPPEQMPPVAPKITYRNGLLEIEAPNCTLGDILNGIRGKTGIQFEGVGSAPDRVATSLGPAPADEVLTSLLFGSRFDFLIVNQVDNPETVQRVVLTPHAGTSAPPSAFVENRGVPATSNNEDEEGGSEDPDAESAVAPPAQGGAAPKTTQQLLQELQQLQKEQQQQPNQDRQPAPLKPPKAGFPQL